MLKIEKRDIKYILKILGRSLKPIGIWPTLEEKWPKLLKTFLIVTTVMLILFLMIPCSLHITLVEKTFQDRLKIFGPLSYMFMCLYKYIAVLSREKYFKKCFDSFKKDWKDNFELEEHKIILLKNSKSAIRWIIVASSFTYGGCIFYTIILPFTKQPMIIGNATIRYLGFPAFYGAFDHQVSY